MWQTLGVPEQTAPELPPTTMRQIEIYTPQELAVYTSGWDSEGIREEGDYAEYVQTYIM